MLLVLIGEDGERAVVQCALCGEVLVAVFTGLSTPEVIVSGSDLEKIQDHEARHEKRAQGEGAQSHGRG
jgi:hypothetical protein